jgi:hypothetical protein
LIGVLGSWAPEFSLAIAGSFQVLILPLKMFAIVSGASWRPSTPCRLYRQVDGVAALAALLGGGGLVGLEGRVRAREGHLALGERLDARARAARVVVEVGAGALLRVDLGPLLDGVLLRARAGGVHRGLGAVDVAGGHGGRARALVAVATTGAEGECARDDHTTEGGKPRTVLHR